jgi:hypothetical protein
MVGAISGAPAVLLGPQTRTAKLTGLFGLRSERLMPNPVHFIMTPGQEDGLGLR